MKKIDLTEKRFGRLVAKRISGKNKRGGYIWECLCDCGNTTNVLSGSLMYGATKSCGCLRNEIVSINGKNNKRYNYYDLNGDYGIGYTFKNEEFLFDLEDYDKIKDYCWHSTKNGYIGTFTYINKVRSGVLFHRLVMRVLDDVNANIDHINHNQADNRKKNLRTCNASLNLMNSKVRNDNTSGYTGISWSKERNKWEVYITVNQKTIKLGRFVSIDKAIDIRDNAEIEYFGEFRYKNLT